MINRFEQDIIYLAGFFDGEGCIGFYPHYPIKSEKKYLKVLVAQIEIEPIELMQSYFGNKIDIQKTKPQYRNLFRLQYHGEKAKDVLANLYPYLRVKKEQARNALEGIY